MIEVFREPVVLFAHLLLPLDPRLARGVGEKLLTREAVLPGELLGPLADEHHVVGLFHDLARD